MSLFSSDTNKNNDLIFSLKSCIYYIISKIRCAENYAKYLKKFKNINNATISFSKLNTGFYFEKQKKLKRSKRLAFYTSFDAWFSDFRFTFFRDLVFNVGKIGGLTLLYYFAPDLFNLINNSFNFGTTG